jgi:hypothetical protein
MRSVCPSPSSSPLPPPPPLVTGGLDLGGAGGVLAGGRSESWAVVVVMQAASGIPLLDGAVACGGSDPSLGSGGGVPPSFSMVWQGPPRGGAMGPRVVVRHVLQIGGWLLL